MRTIWTVLLVMMVLLAMAAPAMADHTHVRLLGNGKCVILAADGGESQVQLPHAEDFPDNRQHPLHVNVHLGNPGTIDGDAVVWVLGSEGDLANCDGYVNGV